MPFKPGTPKPLASGRRPGTPNKITRRIKETLEVVLSEPESEIRLRALRDSEEPADRATFWRLASRLVPSEVSATIEGKREVVYRVYRGPKPISSEGDAQTAPSEVAGN